MNANLNARGPQLRDLISKLAQETGNPRVACLRFARQLGLNKRRYRHWTNKEQNDLEQLISPYPIKTVALKLRRPCTAVYGTVRRMGLSGRLSREGMTMYALAAALNTRPQAMRNWIAAGLAYRNEGTERLPRIIINPDDFARFYKSNRERVIGNRITKDRVEFVIKHIFPPSHMELLPVRESKKERMAYQRQIFEEENEIDDERDDLTSGTQVN